MATLKPVLHVAGFNLIEEYAEDYGIVLVDSWSVDHETAA
jgi:hypothetical protein